MSTKEAILFSLSLVVLLTLVLFIVFSDQGLVDLYALRQEKRALLNQNNRLVEQNIRLIRAVDRLNNDLEYIENVARQELGMVGRDEVILKIEKDAK